MLLPPPRAGRSPVLSTAHIVSPPCAVGPCDTCRARQVARSGRRGASAQFAGRASTMPKRGRYFGQICGPAGESAAPASGQAPRSTGGATPPRKIAASVSPAARHDDGTHGPAGPAARCESGHESTPRRIRATPCRPLKGRNKIYINVLANPKKPFPCGFPLSPAEAAAKKSKKMRSAVDTRQP